MENPKSYYDQYEKPHVTLTPRIINGLNNSFETTPNPKMLDINVQLTSSCQV